ncbi:extracellular solute-binding protein [Paenibacillus agaridevorans]|uniref:extracellular solute-binding protein n=1 Tax=Paenibacillus agaridevorans TaxID=171404 RepID=UPI001BE40818|nr:extracellular solute-binding protein [Paenibacillus agaridevorans]
MANITMKSAGAAMLAIMLLVLGACSGRETDPIDRESAKPTNGTKTEEWKEWPKEGPLGKYDPPIVLTTGRDVAETMKFEEGRSIDNNIWYDAYRDELGILIKNEWVVKGSEAYTNKTNIAIASGDTPDIMAVDALQLRSLVEADLIEDLTDVYAGYASAFTKNLLKEDGGLAMKASTFGGKLYALPLTNSNLDEVPMLWVRDDWMKKLNLPEPTTMENMFAIAKAFTEQDPDGNSKDDTYGLALVKEAKIPGFFNGFHAYPGAWVEGQDGKIVYGSTQPEMKAALQKLADMFKAGYIDKEFGVKDGPKYDELIASGKVGMMYGPMYAPLANLKNNKLSDPNAEWRAYPLPSADDQPALAQVGVSATSFYVVKKGYQHPEALVKLMNFWNDKSWDNADVMLSRNAETKIETWPYGLVKAFPVLKNVKAHRAVKAALEIKNPEGLDTEQRFYYDAIQNWFEKGDIAGNSWGFYRSFGMDGAGMEIIDYYLNENKLINTEFLGGSTPTMAEKMATLNKMESVMTIKIILGQSGIEEFDKFVKDWNELGGEIMTQEVNDWVNAAN